jgi:hypothetical protein
MHCTTECGQDAPNGQGFCFSRFDDGPPKAQVNPPQKFGLTHEQLVAKLNKIYTQGCFEKYNCAADDRACSFHLKDCQKSCWDIAQMLGYPADAIQEGCPSR